MAAALGRSLEVPMAVGGLSQVGHPHDDEVSSSSEEQDADAQGQGCDGIPEEGELPLLVTPTNGSTTSGEYGVDHNDVVVEDTRLSITRVEEFPTLERVTSGDISASQLQQEDQSDASCRSHQPFDNGILSPPPPDDAGPSSTAVYCQSLSRCGIALLPWGSAHHREQVLLATSVLSVSLALGACALYFREDVGAATNMNSGLVFGSAGSLAMCSVVIGAYVSIKWYRRHMHTLLVNLALCEFFLALSFVLEPAWRHLGAGAGDGLSCRWLSTVREYLIMCSSAWTTCTALDLYYLMTNPFTSPRLNRRKYQFIAHGAAASSAVIMALSDSFAAPVAVGDFCWVGAHSTVSTDPSSPAGSGSGPPESSSAGIWLFVVAPAAVTLGVNSYVSSISYARFRGGIAATLRARQALLREGFLTTVTLALYSALLWGVYGGYWLTSSTPVDPSDNSDDGGREQRSELLAHAFAFLLSYRGSVPFVLWCLYRRPSSASASTRKQDKPGGFLWTASRSKRPSAAVVDAATLRPVPSEHSSEAEEEDDDAVRPQMNRALLEELVHFTTQGIAVAVRAASADDSSGGNDTSRTFTLSPTAASDTATPSPGAWSTDVACKFTDFRPAAFRRVRQVFRIDDASFLASLSACTTPKVSEGASGAFMFYSTDRSFIVKSLSSHESGFLHSFLDKYLAHVSTHRDTFLTRFLGSYCLVLYGRKAHFAVMENVFDVQHGISIHQRYDIKGSWIDRNAQKPRRGAEATCRHCNLTFRYGLGRNVCPNRAGTSHEPNVVLKDMDLTTKLRFGKKQGRLLLQQLKRDSDFLCEHGIMDYSLLLGVIEVSYQVNQHNVLTRDGSVFLQNILEVASAEQERDTDGDGDGGQDAAAPRVKQSTRCLRASEVVIGPGFYYIGIIDILQTWSVGKRVERFVKTALLRSDPDGISAMPPRAYRDRFHRKLHEIIHLGHNSIAVPSSAAGDGDGDGDRRSQFEAAAGQRDDLAATARGAEPAERLSVDRSTVVRPKGVPACWPPDPRGSGE